jgi:alpha-ribazole phosphatase
MAFDFQLTLIRHLPTPANVARRYIGWSDESIVHTDWVINPAITCTEIIYGSDLRRCHETANLFYPNVTYQGFQAFRELSFGDWELKTYEDLKDDSAYRQWLSNPLVASPPNGESFQVMGERVLAGLKGLHGSCPVVVTHGGPIRFLLTQFAPEEKDFWSWDVKHGDRWSLSWSCRELFEEGKRCESLSVERLMEKEPT